MKNAIVFLLCTLMLMACNSTPKDTAAQDSSQSIASKVAESPKDSVTIVPTADNTLPSEIKVQGDVYSVQKWTDKNGENVLVLSTLTSSKEDKEADMTLSTKELFAILYVKKDNAYTTLWKMYDLVKECPFDITAEFIGQPDVTDLDQDGEKETFINYRITCRSDVSPSTLKIVGHEGKTKFALRGPMWVKMAEDDVLDETMEPDLSKVQDADGESSFGRYENANEFQNQPKAFLEFARASWISLREERF